MENVLAKMPEGVHEMQSWSPKDVLGQIQMIQQLMREGMTDGQHYGTIPGCGDKKVLMKSGAEKLGLMFRLAPKFEVTTKDLGNGHREEKVTCSLYHINTGLFWGQGVGSCSTMESNYRYRGNEAISTGVTVPKEYWDLKNAGKFAEASERLGGKGYIVKKLENGWFICEKGEKTENPDIADTYNTVLKIAKKRAVVDATITATAASDIFTQDLDETLPEAPKVAPSTVTPPKQETSNVGHPDPLPDVVGEAHANGENLLSSRFSAPEKFKGRKGDYWKTKDSEAATLYIFEEALANHIASVADKDLTVVTKMDGKYCTIVGYV